MKLHNYIHRYLSVAIIIVLTLWVLIFYAFMIDEVYDNIDDGLKNEKAEIIRTAYYDPTIKSAIPFNTSGFRITPIESGEYSRKNVFSTEMIYMDSDDNEEPVRILTTTFSDKEDNEYLLEIRTSTIEADDLMKDFGVAVGILYLVLLITIYVINHFLLRRRVWNSFYSLLDNLKSYTIGKQIITPETETPIREFNDLGNEITKMIDRIENMVEQQKTFVSNAAHESQTPLAIINNKLELLVESEELTDQQMVQIQSIHKSLSRLVKLNKSLLMLAKIENKQFSNYQEVNFNEIIISLVEDFEDIFAYKNVTVEVTQAETPFIFHMDKGLALMLVQNLVKNAMIHNLPEGTITISITPHSFTISNTSVMNSSLDENLIYNRFFRSTTSEESTGLGLSLVQTIIKVTDNLSLSYHFDKKHFFTIYHSDYSPKN